MKKEIFFSILIAIAITMLGVCTTKVCSESLVMWATMLFVSSLAADVVTATVMEAMFEAELKLNTMK